MSGAGRPWGESPLGEEGAPRPAGGQAAGTAVSGERWLLLPLGVLGGAALLALMMVTVVDVASRSLGGFAVVGAYELSELAIALIVAAGMPLVAVRGSHLSIDLLQARFTGRFREAQSLLVALATALAEGFFAWCLAEQAWQAAASGRGSAVLHLPVAPVLFAAAALLALAALISVAMILRRLRIRF